MTDPQKLVDQVKEAIKYYLENFYHSMGSGRIGHDAYAALDRLSAYLAEQEKAVRVKVLEEIREKFLAHRWLGDDQSIAFFNRIIDQKIEEARK